ncbi:MAG: hypothetical protein ACI8RP_001676, partial [Urechidicola sp.]
MFYEIKVNMVNDAIYGVCDATLFRTRENGH